ncbi:MAG: hypothetical protein P8Y71_25910, partial [Pseudolabrys sp.]
MSNPVGRSSIPNVVSAYAPKRTRNFDGSEPVPIARRHEISDTITNNNNFESEPFQVPKSLDPSFVPDPPASESLWRRGARYRKSRAEANTHFLGVVIIAALVAIGVTFLMPM